ncbi:MAG: hypothetical protein ACE5HX_19085 [bacterium]
MLIKKAIEPYKDRIVLVVEDWGKSKLAQKHNIKEYPIIFINEEIFARPEDFGYMGKKGKYAPWYDRKNQVKFLEELDSYLKGLLGRK